MTIQNPIRGEAEEVPCRADPERMFPSSHGAARPAEDKAAKEVCRTGNNGEPCPVLDACLRYALRYDVDGIWAATTPDERQAIRERSGVVPISVASTVLTRNVLRVAS